MAGLCTFVCYALESSQDVQFAQRLIADLRAAGIEVVTCEKRPGRAMGEDVIAKLQKCQWVILVQTPAALCSPQVQLTIETALDLSLQQRMHGVLSMIAAPYSWQNTPPETWTVLKAFDASEDYPKALTRLLLALHPATSASVPSVPVRAAPPPTFQPMIAVSAGSEMEPDGKPARFMPLWLRKKQLKSWLIPLSIVLTLALCIGVSVEVFAMMTMKPLITHTAAKKHLPTIMVTSPVNTPIITPTPIATEVPTQPPSPTPTPDIATIAKSLYTNVMQQQPTMTDPLHTQDGNNWDISKAGGCAFTGNSYGVTTALPTAQAATWGYCLARNTNFSNFAYQVQMTSNANLPSFCGLVFRANTAADIYSSYRLYVGSDASYELDGYNKKTLTKGPAPAINTGQATNTITAIAQNNDIFIYINGNFIDHVSDGAANSGAIGMVCKAQAGAAGPVEAAFQSVKVWGL
ncbi:MAG TPA: TIR domain-containing protein [Ktedonobacteraceae bacterium]|nr:TIR domain-containing protein [Ktedonobacteraceae bacterium]